MIFARACVLPDVAIFRGLHTATQLSGKGRKQGPELLLRHGPRHFLLLPLPLRRVPSVAVDGVNHVDALVEEAGIVACAARVVVSLSPARTYCPSPRCRWWCRARPYAEILPGHPVNGRRSGHPGS